MSRRISAGELQARYETKHELLDFFDEMKSQIFEHMEDKGTSWKGVHIKYLIKELRAHVSDEDWVGVANFAFMLRNRELQK